MKVRLWRVRFALREAHAELGSLSVSAISAAIVAIVGVVVAFVAAGWIVALITAALGPVALWLCLSAQRYYDVGHHGHPDFRSQIDRGEGNVTAWLSLKPGRAPRGVHELGLLVRRADDQDRGVILAGVSGTRTINHVGSMPPHLTYPDQFPGAPPLVDGTYQFIWSEIQGGKRREFLLHEYQHDSTTPPAQALAPAQAPGPSGSGS